MGIELCLLSKHIEEGQFQKWKDTDKKKKALRQLHIITFQSFANMGTVFPPLSSENRHKLRFQTDHFQQPYKMFPLTKLIVTFGRLSCSVGKESTCNAGDPSSIPGSGRSGGKGIGYPLQYSWVSLVAQLVKNLSAVQETWV